MKKSISFALALLTVITILTGCGQDGNGYKVSVKETPGNSYFELNMADNDSLMKQIAEREVQKRYEKYLPDRAFAIAEIFGVDRDGDKGSAYVYLNTAEFVILKGKAYKMSGSAGEAIIRFTYTENGPRLTKVDWSADGGGHDAWIKRNFPKAYLKKWSAYEAYDKNGKNKIGTKININAAKAMGVPVETENLLEIDSDKGTYKIIKAIDTMPFGKFEVKTIDSGKLKTKND